jgi:hypothetical protein
MKKLLIGFLFACIVPLATIAQDTANGQTVAISELPEVIRGSLTGQEYIGWAVGNAFKKEKNGKIVYAVELKKDAETRVIKFDAAGNKLKEKERSKN